MTVSHWDEVEPERRDVGDMRATFRALGEAAGATVVGVARIDVDPGCRPGPVHQHASEEEIFFVLEGSGLAWIDGAVHEIGGGDAMVYLAGGPEHTIVAGDEGLSVLAYGENHAPPLVRLPRAGMARRGDLWLELSRDDPLERELAAGPLTIRDATPRPPCIVALQDVEAEVMDKGRYADSSRGLGLAAGSLRTGLNHAVMAAGKWSCPPHWHAAEEELFVILEGGGDLLLFDNRGELVEEHPLRAGHCVARPGPGRPKLAHALRAGSEGITYLVYGTRRSDEVVYYPISRKAWLGSVLVRLDLADDYWEGEV
jgi:uncharacterized cupin superfamily protein